MNKKITKKVAKAPVSKNIAKKPAIKKALPIKSKSAPLKLVKTEVKVQKKPFSANLKKSEIKKVEDEEITEDDAKVIEESFNLIKNLNTQVESVHVAKERLQQDMSKLNSRLSKHEENNDLFRSKFLLTIKEELIREFTPLLNKMDFKSLKIDMFKEIEKIIDIEVQKSRSEFDSKVRKNKAELVQKISELEMRIIDSLKSNENIKREMKNFEKKEISVIMSEFESRVKSTIELSSGKYISLINKNSKDLEEFKSQLQQQKLICDTLSKNISNFKKQMEGSISKDGVDLSSIESKILKLEKGFAANKVLIEKYENDLYNRENTESSKIEVKVKSTLKDAEDVLSKIKLEKQTSEKQMKENLDLLKQDLVKNLDKNYNQFSEKASGKLNNAINEFNAEKSTLEKDLDLFKVEVSSLIKNYITELDKELNQVKINGANLKSQNTNASKEFEKKLESFRDEVKKSLKSYEDEKNNEMKNVSKKSAELIKAHVENIKKINEENKIIKKGLEVELHLDITEHLNATKEEVSKQIISLNSALAQLMMENKENQRNFSEDIESKFILSKEQFETEFNTHLSSFETELKTKENEFISKLKIIEDDKNLMLKELETFKVDISSLTKNYVAKLDSEFQIIKAQEIKFDEKKKDFSQYMDTIYMARKTEIEEYSKVLKNNINDVLIKQSEIFDMHENTFRDVFNEKIQTLSETTTKRLDSFDKKFVEKNLTVINQRIAEVSHEFKLIEDGLNSKAIEIDKRIESMEKKEQDFYVQLNSELQVHNLKVEGQLTSKSLEMDKRIASIEQKEIDFDTQINKNFHDLNEKIEERLVNYEKQFNKRFLDYDLSFTNFKSTIVDEVEDLIKEVNNVMNVKLENLDKNIVKLNFVNAEATNRLNEFKQIQNVIETEMRDARDDVNDLRVKYEVELTSSQSLNNHVKYMSEYETQLLALIKNLKDKRISDPSIKAALINKGHPRFYVSMILENYDQIINY